LITQAVVQDIQQISILGAGNVAWHIGSALCENGLKILQVYNRTPSVGKNLATSLNAHYISSIEELDSADLYIIAVSDDVIGEIAANAYFKKCTGIVVHTAGSVNMDVFKGNPVNYGVFYPFQSFTKGTLVDFRSVPMLIEGNTDKNAESLTKLASLLSERVYYLNSDQRLMLHLAAVIGANFSNHLLSLCEKILKGSNLTLDLLQPLLSETLSKAMRISPEKAQTGPAIRGNIKIIDKHLAMLEDYPEIREIYRIMSESIMRSSK
jgi:predicted short-subunit dehydrogenase-like oxidoreductase (DUF2520 family)